MTKETDRTRLKIAEKVRRLRQENKWTQTRLAGLLRLSQNRLSEIERGNGSFTAEQFLLILKTFNTSLGYFSDQRPLSDEKRLQNAIVRLGASPLQEIRDLLPSEKLENWVTVIREVLTSATNPRQITALAPVIVSQANSLGLNKLRLDFFGEGRINRLGWLFENVLIAVRNELKTSPHKDSKGWKNHYHRTIPLLENILQYPGFTLLPKEIADPLEAGVLQSKEAFDETKIARDRIAKKWGVVTRIRTEDFIHALRGTREDH